MPTPPPPWRKQLIVSIFGQSELNLCECSSVRITTADHHCLAWQGHLGCIISPQQSHQTALQKSNVDQRCDFDLSRQKAVLLLLNRSAKGTFVVASKSPNLGKRQFIHYRPRLLNVQLTFPLESNTAVCIPPAATSTADSIPATTFQTKIHQKHFT